MGFSRKKKDEDVKCHACGIELKKHDKKIRLFEQVYQPRLKSILCIPCAKPVLESMQEEARKKSNLPPASKS